MSIEDPLVSGFSQAHFEEAHATCSTMEMDASPRSSNLVEQVEVGIFSRVRWEELLDIFL